MKKFQKILGAGLVLAHACSSSLVLGVDSMPRYNSPDLDHVPHGNQVILVKTQRASKKFSIATMFFKLLRLGFTAEAIHQLLCANCPSMQIALAGYADTESFKFSEQMRPYASLARLGELVDKGYPDPDYFDTELICTEIPGGFATAAKIAVLGFAKDIYVMPTGSNQFTFYYIPGNYGLTSVDACIHLQHLIDKVTVLQTSAPQDSDTRTDAADLLARLNVRKELLSSCVPYQALAATRTYAAKLAGFVSQLQIPFTRDTPYAFTPLPYEQPISPA